MGIAHVTLSSSLKVLGKLLLPLIKFGQNEFLQKSRLRGGDGRRGVSNFGTF